MKAKSALVLLLLVGVVMSLPTASAHEEIFTANLSGPNEDPANGSPGTGFVTVTLDLDLFTMRVQADFTSLQGTTTAAHIHAPTTTPFTGNADVATQVPTFESFPLSVTSGAYDHTFNLALASSYNPDFITASGGTIFSGFEHADFCVRTRKRVP